MDESNAGRSFHEIETNRNLITVTTKINDQKKQVMISIQENGVGMSEEVRAKIFDHLFTTKAVGKGTGLGLTIAYQIVVEKHGGTIEVNSTPGQGAAFVIALELFRAMPVSWSEIDSEESLREILNHLESRINNLE